MLNILYFSQDIESCKKNENLFVWTFVFMNYGNFIFWIEQEKVSLVKGDLLLIPPKIPFHCENNSHVLNEKYILTFEIKIEKPILPILELTKYIKSNTGKFELIADRFLFLQSQWVDKIPYYEVMCHAVFLEVLTHWNRELDHRSHSNIKAIHLQTMKGYIQNHYREKVTKDDLGWAIKKSPNYAAALFSEITGQTISEFIHKMRVKKAIYMLHHSQMNVGEVAEFLGYSDTSYFHKVFKRINGSSPSDLLQNKVIL
jgi:YesN/AraC family two-component response regulator